jgi:hypothetical protein
MKYEYPPKFIFVLTGLLITVWWFVFFSIEESMGMYFNTTKKVFLLFLPLTSTPYIIWVIHKESHEGEEYLNKMYDSRFPWLRWFVYAFMMVVISALGTIILLLIAGVIGLIYNIFQ